MAESLDRIIEKIKAKISSMEAERIRIAVFGQPGAGKSSLVNSIIGEEQAAVSIKTDATGQVETYEYENLFIADFPGYGTEKFPADNYLQQFKLLDYDIFLCVFSGKLHIADISFFKQLNSKQRLILFVRTYSDGLWQAGKTTKELQQEITANICQQLGSTERVFFVSNISGEGVEELLIAINNLIEPAKRDAFVRSVKAESEQMLQSKYAACTELINSYCRLAALNGVNPLLGVDIAVDMGILAKMFADIRQVYGLTGSKLSKAAIAIPLAKQIVTYGTEWGLAVLLKSVGKRVAISKAVKLVPIAGQVAAAGMGYWIVKKAGYRYLTDCQQLAHKLLKIKLDATDLHK